MPANVNDDELDPDMTEFPKSKTGCTEMTFGLIRFEITSTLRKLQYVPPGPRKCNRLFTEMSMEKKESWIKECHEKLENQYIKDGDMNVPLYWVNFLYHFRKISGLISLRSLLQYPVSLCPRCG